MYRPYLRLKACPRCGGDILVERPIYDEDEVCLQCGFRKFKKVKYPRHLRDLTKTTELKLNRQAKGKVIANR